MDIEVEAEICRCARTLPWVALRCVELARGDLQSSTLCQAEVHRGSERWVRRRSDIQHSV